MKDILKANLKRILDILESPDADITGVSFYDNSTNSFHSSQYNLKSELKAKMREFRRDSIKYEKLIYNTSYQSKVTKEYMENLKK